MEHERRRRREVLLGNGHLHDDDSGGCRPGSAPGDHQWLDLGDVQNLAEVSVNGANLGIVWKKPFRVDITGAAKPGANVVEVKVTNLWVNRMIGDRQPGAAEQFTFTRPVFYKANSPLLPSGLLGPVRLLSRSDAPKVNAR